MWWSEEFFKIMNHFIKIESVEQSYKSLDLKPNNNIISMAMRHLANDIRLLFSAFFPHSWRETYDISTSWVRRARLHVCVFCANTSIGHFLCAFSLLFAFPTHLCEHCQNYMNTYIFNQEKNVQYRCSYFKTEFPLETKMRNEMKWKEQASNRFTWNKTQTSDKIPPICATRSGKCIQNSSF